MVDMMNAHHDTDGLSGFLFNDDDDRPVPTTPRKGAKVHRALYGGGVLCESSVGDEHRANLVMSYDDDAVTCKACRRRIVT